MAGKTPRMSRHGATSASASAASVVNTVVSAPSGILAQWTRGADTPTTGPKRFSGDAGLVVEQSQQPGTTLVRPSDTTPLKPSSFVGTIQF